MCVHEFLHYQSNAIRLIFPDFIENLNEEKYIYRPTKLLIILATFGTFSTIESKCFLVQTFSSLLTCRLFCFQTRLIVFKSGDFWATLFLSSPPLFPSGSSGIA